MLSRLRAYYLLTKPGIVYGNLLAAIGGFFLAANGQAETVQFIAMVSGLALVIASACVFNNFLDRKIDTKMERTKKRPIASGIISPQSALIYGTILGIIGTYILLQTTLLAVAAGFVGWFSYVFIYGYSKRRTPHGTLIGTVPGAMPPVVGYLAVTGSFDTAAFVLFVILAMWQMPHFYALAIFRRKEYAAASIPVLPLAKGMDRTKREIRLYAIGFVAASLLPTILGYTGYVYAAVMLLLGVYWLRVIYGPIIQDNKWAGKVFGSSLTVLLVFSLMISVGGLLP